LGPEWFPHKSKIVLVWDADSNRIAVHVDPNTPGRWREEPYYSQIKLWASSGADQRLQVIVYVKERAIIVFPNKEIDLGFFTPTDQIVVVEKNGAFGRDWDAYIVPEKISSAKEQTKSTKLAPGDASRLIAGRMVGAANIACSTWRGPRVSITL
jgi:hypothetical protein